MQVQLTRKFCLRQNLSPRATGFVDPEGLGKSTCRKQKLLPISFLSEQFLDVYKRQSLACGRRKRCWWTISPPALPWPPPAACLRPMPAGRTPPPPWERPCARSPAAPLTAWRRWRRFWRKTDGRGTPAEQKTNLARGLRPQRARFSVIFSVATGRTSRRRAATPDIFLSIPECLFEASPTYFPE